jgi:hypothetical protein
LNSQLFFLLGKFFQSDVFPFDLSAGFGALFDHGPMKLKADEALGRFYYTTIERFYTMYQGRSREVLYVTMLRWGRIFFLKSMAGAVRCGYKEYSI